MVVDKFGRGVDTSKRRYVLAFPDAPYVSNKRLVELEKNDDVVSKNYLDTLLESFTTKDDLESLKKDLQKILYFFDVDNKRIIRINEPIAGFHAVTKTYVDNKDKATKLQIRAECEKVKQEAVAEGNKKREQIKMELLKACEAVRKDVDALEKTVGVMETTIKVLQNNRRIDNLFIDALYKHLNIVKSSVNTNVSKTADN